LMAHPQNPLGQQEHWLHRPVVLELPCASKSPERPVQL
jgi:hypothetical protein